LTTFAASLRSAFLFVRLASYVKREIAVSRMPRGLHQAVPHV
jgi:hypothetical protein